MIEPYHNATCFAESIIHVLGVEPIPSSIETPFFKIPLHIPSISTVSSPMPEKIVIMSSSSFIKATTVQIPAVEDSIHNVSSSLEVTLS